jgi:hypothetical protein
MFSKTTRLERGLILAAALIATLVVGLIFASTLARYIQSIQPTPTLRSLPPVWTATSPAPTATLRPSSTPVPSITAAPPQ